MQGFSLIEFVNMARRKEYRRFAKSTHVAADLSRTRAQCGLGIRENLSSSLIRILVQQVIIFTTRASNVPKTTLRRAAVSKDLNVVVEGCQPYLIRLSIN